MHCWRCLLVLQLTWADICLLSLNDYLSRDVVAESQVANYPKLKALREKVSKMPKIAQWLVKRPITSF